MKIPNFLLRFLLQLKLGRPFGQYEIVVADKEDLIEEIYRFRFKVYCLIDELLDKENYPKEIERDEYDEHSVQIVALNRNKEIAGTVRIIPNVPLGLPTIKEFGLEEKLKGFPFDRAVEISRFMIAPRYRGTMLMLDLCKAAYLYTKEKGVKYYIGCGEDWFLKLIGKVFGKVETIGNPIFCFNAINYPFLIDTKKFESETRKRNWFLFQYFNHKDGYFKF